jgi:signal transduction histidine kinase
MHERAALLGGELTVTSKPAAGTAIRASIPTAEMHSPGVSATARPAQAAGDY